MLVHLNTRPVLPKRVVVMGAGGFVGKAVSAHLAKDGVPVLALGRGDIDLLAPDAAARLALLLHPQDVFVAVSARAPVKNPDMLVENMVMARAMVQALADAPVSHVVNVSSDAIYGDSHDPITEEFNAAPGSLHGVMHLARELMFGATVKTPSAMVRPTLIYGPGDPHNGYGPNRFRRLAAKGENIILFGEGEERRDHVYIDDVAELITRVIYHGSVGSLNIATGEVHSFREIAEKSIQLAGRGGRICGSPRSGPMPHNGYRPFDIAACKKAFPDFTYTSLTQGLELAQKE
jgi:nucleoside-diphosphate-sugar epimerase